MRVVQAPEDAGFAASVNRGLAGAGSDDVVVLREDVVVVDGWIERLQRAAYGEERIGMNTRRRFKWRDIYDIDFTADPGHTIDRRLVLAATVGMDALQAR